AHSAAWHVGLDVGDLALCGLTLSHVRLTPDTTNRPRERCREIKKWGAPSSTPRSLAEELPLLRGLFLPALGSLLRHCFLLRICGSTSDGPRGRHNGWAEPSTLIPDVDY